MSILSGHKKSKNYLTDASGNHTEVSYHTYADTVNVGTKKDGTELTLADREIEITQAEYDALVAANKVEPDAIYYITDGAGGGGVVKAANTTYDNSESGLEADNVQAAVDELNHNMTQLQMVKLWENQAPEGDFSSQTINIDLSGYDYVKIFTRWDRANGSESCTDVRVGSYAQLQQFLILSNGTHYVTRTVNVSHTGVTFETGITGRATTQTISDQFCVPLAIYAGKFTS